MNKKFHRLRYIITDFLTATIAWSLFFIFRKIYIENIEFSNSINLHLEYKFYLGLCLVPIFWVLLYSLTGYYKDVFRKSRLKELAYTFYITVLGTIFIFFTSILDDFILSYKDYYTSLFALFIIHFFLTYIPRFIITNQTVYKIRNGKIIFNTLMVGSNERAVKLYQDFTNQPKSSGNHFVGFISVLEKKKYLLNNYLKHLGSFDEINELIEKYKVKEVIIAIETSEHDKIGNILNKLYMSKVVIKVIPNMYDILTGTANMSTLFSSPLIQISHDLLPAWEKNLKRLIDIVISIIALIILIPTYIFLAISVKLSSKGPIFYGQERIGIYGKPFFIWKFRSMYIDAEKHGPALSSQKDKRITKFGKFMRKMRLDETPQFYNVLIGDMSLVGPRPERQFFIEQIAAKAPHYYHLQKVRPGITSWGQVKYGYAENVSEMVQRLKYDIIYIENMSIYVDFKILIYTVKIILQGRGK